MAKDETLILMEVKGLIMDPSSSVPIVVLRSEEHSKILPIWIGIFEANAIALQIENISTPRPMTHDLLKNVLGDLEANVQKIVVCELKDNTFYAMIYVNRNGEVIAIDSRPSDAIALALRTKSPIFVEESVVEGAKGMDLTKDATDSEKLQKWLEGLNPEDLGKYKM